MKGCEYIQNFPSSNIFLNVLEYQSQEMTENQDKDKVVGGSMASLAAHLWDHHFLQSQYPGNRKSVTEQDTYVHRSRQ